MPASVYTLWSDTEIKFKLPAVQTGHAGIMVWTSTYSKALPFNVTDNPVPVVTAINPKTGINNNTYSVEILGTDFVSGVTVRLVKDTTVINGEGVVLQNPGRITCKFNLKSVPIGKYDLHVTNPTGGEAKVTSGFTVLNTCGQGATASITVLAGLMGLLSLAGLGLKRRQASKSVEIQAP